MPYRVRPEEVEPEKPGLEGPLARLDVSGRSGSDGASGQDGAEGSRGGQGGQDGGHSGASEPGQDAGSIRLLLACEPSGAEAVLLRGTRRNPGGQEKTLKQSVALGDVPRERVNV